MHSALLIDEILELVLDKCSDWDRQAYQHAAVQIAQTCKAWKDPALDRIWRRLGDVTPLIELLEDVKGCDGSKPVVIPQHHPFHSYAAHVQHIILRQCPAIVSYPTTLLPKLSSVILNRSGCNANASWIMSEHLREVQIIIGTMEETVLAHERGVNVANVLQRWREAYPHSRLSKLHIRGWLSPVLTQVISPFTSLRSLSLLYGSGVTPELLRAVSLFSHLEEFRVHANGVSADEFNTLPLVLDAVTFPRLRSLMISGTHPLLTALLDLLPTDTLEVLFLEVHSPLFNATHWKPILDMVSVRTCKSLRRLDIHHDVPLDDSPTLLIPAHLRGDNAFTLDCMRSLSILRGLQSLNIDIPIPPQLSDQDIDEIVSWWPQVKRIGLGTLPLDITDAMHLWQPQTTVAVFPIVARRCPHLESLMIPLDFSLAPDAELQTKGTAPSAPQHALRRLMIGNPLLSGPPSTFVQDVLGIFPSLQAIDRDCGRYIQDFYARESFVSEDKPLVGEKERNASTADGFANGY